MNPYALSQVEAEEYLNHIEVLAEELTNAMEAMVSMELPAFELSVQRQRILCTNLASLPHRAGRPHGLANQPAEPADSDLQTRLRQASGTLDLLNRQYSALLQHSGDTLKVLAGLLRTYSPQPPPTGIQSRVQTWSCTI